MLIVEPLHINRIDLIQSHAAEERYQVLTDDQPVVHFRAGPQLGHLVALEPFPGVISE